MGNLAPAMKNIFPKPLYEALTKNKAFLPLTISLAVLVLLVLGNLKLTPATSSVHFVELTEAGFNPKELTVSRGDTVKFTTTGNKLFWPASNAHPIHGIYPEFDPKKPIDSSDFWSFQFDKVGEWKYHDHLNPQFSGVVVVIQEKKGGGAKNSCQDIQDESFSKTKKDYCWDVIMSNIIKKEGIEEGFKFLSDARSTSSDFDQQCHSAAHRLGRAILDKFRANAPVKISEQSQWCGYGVYHGFMENLLVSGSEIAVAHNFCRSINFDLLSPVDYVNECYHGMGHGVAEFYSSKTPQDEVQVQNTSLTECEKSMSSLVEKRSCAVGVYGWLLNQLPYFEQRKLSPVEYCKKQDGAYQDICLMGAMRHFRNFFSEYVVESVDFFLGLKDQERALAVALSFAKNFSGYDRSRNDYLLSDFKNCKALPAASYPQCVKDILKPLKS